MISLNAFIGEWIGRIPTHPKGITGQCVCLYRCYLDEVLGVPQTVPVIGAQDLYNKADPKYFLKLPNTLTFIPKLGDIFIMAPFTGNPFGHVGMVTSATLFSVQSFDANWSVPKRANREKHGYGSILTPSKPRIIGFLRKR
jgi:hypothetical protein